MTNLPKSASPAYEYCVECGNHITKPCEGHKFDHGLSEFAALQLGSPEPQQVGRVVSPKVTAEHTKSASPSPWRIEYYANHAAGCKILDANGHWVCSIENVAQRWVANFIVSCVNRTAKNNRESASPSEPRTQQDAPIEHGCNAPSPEGIADRDRASNSTSAERDEIQALEQVCKLITEFDISEGKQHRRNLAIDALYRWRNVTEKYLAARACASPLPQTPLPMSEEFAIKWMQICRPYKIGPSVATPESLTERIRASLPQPSAGQWIKVEASLPEPMQEVDIVVVRTSAGEFVDQWSQIAWRRPDGLWIDDDDIVERVEPWDSTDRREIKYWAKRRELPERPGAASEGEENG